MSPFWTSINDELDKRGRTAMLFIFAILIGFSLLLFAVQIPRAVYVDYGLPGLPWAGLLVAVGLVKGFLKSRTRSREQLGRSTLSRDEWNKARSKLVKIQNRKML